MISGFVINKVSGNLDSVENLPKQRFPKLNINFDKVEKDSDDLKVDYSFTADYSSSDSDDKKDKVGSIMISGYMLISDSKENVDAALDKWNNKHTLPVKIAEEVINGLNFRCSATGTLLAYTLNLIPPLVISQTKVEEPKEKEGTSS